MREAFQKAQGTLETLELTLRGADEARMHGASTLEELERTLKALRNLVDYIQTHPRRWSWARTRAKEKK